MTVAARASNVVEGNADRRIGIAALHGQIKIDDGVGRIARDDEPMMFDARAALIVGHMIRPRQAEKKRKQA